MRIYKSAVASLILSSGTSGRKTNPAIGVTAAFGFIGAPRLAFATSSLISTCPTKERAESYFSSPLGNCARSQGLLDIRPTIGFSSKMSSATCLFSSRGGATEEAVANTEDSTIITSTPSPKVYYRSDYKPLPYRVTHVSMDFSIHPNQTLVTSHLTIESSSATTTTMKDNWVLDGDGTSLKLTSIQLNGNTLLPNVDYAVTDHELIIFPHARENTMPLKNGTWKLTTVVEICPESNTQLSGLYKSGSMYCTQCEAMGFRRITYYPDRPDNMATFESIRLEADEDLYPVLLSNGNLIESGTVATKDVNHLSQSPRRHYAVWSDPFPKPSYLFCIVAGGQLGSIQDEYITQFSKRRVRLQIFSEVANRHKLDFAMQSLKKSMKWDEDTFGLEYDLDVYNIVAVNDFNMGAMENKGLNVFNTAYVLADPTTATDIDYERIEGVIGHEYFHNWTGNRVTCRDWFQLTLKEGLTVFRDQQFSSDMMGSFAVKRIEDVKALRARQFSEDAGPMSHPIRPDSYISMDNFYTSTVYNKGAEVIRMYHTILSAEGFRKGMDLYFKRHDGMAVTCDDFRAAMADANNINLDQFALWYSTSGTPTVIYSSAYDKDKEIFSLTLTQKSKIEAPLHIPVSVGLLDKATGAEVVPTTVLELKENSQKFEFKGIKGDVVTSILRDFSAPVKIMHVSGEEKEEDLAFLAAFDSNGFNKWEAGQKLYTNLIFQVMNGKDTTATRNYVMDAWGRTLRDLDSSDFSIKAYALTLPSESSLSEALDNDHVVDPVAIHIAREKVKNDIARSFANEIRTLYNSMTALMDNEKELIIDAESIGRRRLRNVLLEYLCSIRGSPEEEAAAADFARAHYQNAKGMTDKMSALVMLSSMNGQGSSARDQALNSFFEAANGDALVLNKWFTAQATADLPDVLDRVKTLTKHPEFVLSNPNRFRSLVSAFTMNQPYFHAADGSGYQFIADMIVDIDKLNPQVSSRLATSLINWKKYGEERGSLMKGQLQRIASQKLSDDLFEVVSRGLQ